MNQSNVEIKITQNQNEINEKIVENKEILYHCKSVDHIVDLFNTNLEEGLTTTEAKQRLLVDGTNELKSKYKVTWYKILYRQVANLLSILLIALTIFCYIKQNWPEAGVLSFCPVGGQSLSWDTGMAYLPSSIALLCMYRRMT